VAGRIKAGRKVLWLHGDMDTNEGAAPAALKVHSSYDMVVGVAGSIIKSYLRYHPEDRAKTRVVYNFTDMEGVLRKAEAGETFSDPFDGVRILTAGRLDHQKGYDMAIGACRRLADDGFRFRWYVLGEGVLRAELEDRIRREHLEDIFVLMGNKPNPYGFMKQCDLYVQPSRTEGFCTATNEAKILKKTVITTDVSGAREQFRDGYDGWIVPVSEEALYEKLKWCLEDMDRASEVAKHIEMDRSGGRSRVSWLYEE
jgi:glycosyltransferase involved in cell wall biosynthesis